VQYKPQTFFLQSLGLFHAWVRYAQPTQVLVFYSVKRTNDRKLQQDKSKKSLFAKKAKVKGCL
jgi:hypothetical protein